MTRAVSIPTTSRSSLVIGTRGSRLAVWQAEWIQARLHEIAPALTVTLQRIKTSGDKILDVPLAKIGGKGLFVKEIEEALLEGEIDLAVHSMKDVPTVLPDALEILCVPSREDARDALISREGRKGWTLDQLPAGARIGTSSLRRQSQLLHYRPDLKIEMLRGNVETRLRKLKQGDYDAIVLASAGLRRMGLNEEVTEYLSLDVSVPAIGQGALAIEGRRDDEFVRALLSELNDPITHTAVAAERALLDRLQGGCQVPIAAHATIERDRLVLDGLVASPDGTTLIRDAVAGAASDARALGTRLAEQLLAAGGDVILRDLYGRE
ncbi:MAG TPA: hydroxymethylbilane synthase [Nitrospiraceae bacterium]|nr:hydroxymethylbilane synthase [Nitrospiraceae bacterium]